MSEKLDNIFDLEPIKEEEKKAIVLVPENPNESVEDTDFTYTRQNQIELIEISKSAVETAMKVAVNSEHPKALESLAIMLKTASEMNRQLVLQSKDRAEAKSAKKNTPQALPNIENAQTVNNIVMTGTLKDIMGMIKSSED